jgi:hypothetical protein
VKGKYIFGVESEAWIKGQSMEQRTKHIAKKKHEPKG